jgi:hypothetical protein
VSTPTIAILGVYHPEISQETWDEQWAVTGDDEQTREHFRTLVLIEAVVDELTGRFAMGKFGQMDPHFPDDERHMQVGYDEALLSNDGEVLIQRRMNCIHGTGPLRFAVYLHRYDPNRPLLWQGGKIECPPAQDMPVRLVNLVPYTACT